jgi:hypothetical protein
MIKEVAKLSIETSSMAGKSVWKRFLLQDVGAE